MVLKAIKYHGLRNKYSLQNSHIFIFLVCLYFFRSWSLMYHPQLVDPIKRQRNTANVVFVEIFLTGTLGSTLLKITCHGT